MGSEPGCWISLRELGRLKSIDNLVAELVKFNDDVIDWDKLTGGQLNELEELMEQMGNIRNGGKE